MVLPCGSNPKVTIRADQHSEHLRAGPVRILDQLAFTCAEVNNPPDPPVAPLLEGWRVQGW